VELNPPPHTQHSGGVGGCNEGSPNATAKAKFPTLHNNLIFGGE